MPAFFMSCLTEEIVSALQTDIETRLADAEPDVEVLLAEVVSGTTLRLFIDHPDGVSLGLCERVSGALNDYRERYALEVSSPGGNRPLTKPQHYSRFLGRHARVRLREARDGHKNVTGELVEQRLVEATTEQVPTVDPETGEMREPPEPEIDLEKLKEYEDQIETEDVTPHDFGRIAAQTAKQVILQRIREAERDMMFEEYRDRVGELITGIVQQSDSRYTLVQLRERVEALLPKSEQVDGERYDHSQRIKAVIKDVSSSTKGPSIIVSRRDPELIKKLFELEVPEIADGLVEITDVAREPGYRSKIAVISHADGVDPVGGCVGPRGSRVRMVVSELRGEKIDIIPYNDEPARFVAKALSPARVREVLVDDAGKQATVIVPDDQLSLAIGREGQNARLAARLTGWRIDIRSETEF